MEDLDLLLQDLESLGMKSCLRQGVDYGWGIDLKGECDGKLGMHISEEALQWLHDHGHTEHKSSANNAYLWGINNGKSSFVLPQKFNDFLEGRHVIFSLHGQVHLFETKVQDPPESLKANGKELYRAETKVLYIVKAASTTGLYESHEILFPLTQNHEESQNLQLRLAQKLGSLTS